MGFPGAHRADRGRANFHRHVDRLPGQLYLLLCRVPGGRGWALLYVLNELFSLGRKISTPTSFAWGLLTGFLTAYATDLFLTVATGA